MDRSNHYETAFEAYLQKHRLCYVAVDETRRSLLGDVRVKSLDFIVHGPSGARLVVDVKGRRFPGGTVEHPRRVWENWSTHEDIVGLERWAARFGSDYRGLLVFAYELRGDVELAANTADLFVRHKRRYLLRAIEVSDYRRQMRVRSPKWGTVCLPNGVFRELIRPLRHFTHAYPVIPQECPF